MAVSKKSKKKKKPKAVKKAVKSVLATIERQLSEPAAPPAPPVKPVVTTYRIAPGKAITSKKGVLGPGKEVKAEYLNGGQKTMDASIQSGHIIKD